MQHLHSGRSRVEGLQPSVQWRKSSRIQEETDEAASILRMKGHAPLGGIFDIRPAVKRATIGGMLSPQEFVQVASTIHASRQFRLFMEDLEEEELELPILQDKVRQMAVLTPLRA